MCALARGIVPDRGSGPGLISGTSGVDGGSLTACHGFVDQGVHSNGGRQPGGGCEPRAAECGKSGLPVGQWQSPTGPEPGPGSQNRSSSPAVAVPGCRFSLVTEERTICTRPSGFTTAWPGHSATTAWFRPLRADARIWLRLAAHFSPHPSQGSRERPGRRRGRCCCLDLANPVMRDHCLSAAPWGLWRPDSSRRRELAAARRLRRERLRRWFCLC